MLNVNILHGVAGIRSVAGTWKGRGLCRLSKRLCRKNHAVDWTKRALEMQSKQKRKMVFVSKGREGIKDLSLWQCNITWGDGRRRMEIIVYVEAKHGIFEYLKQEIDSWNDAFPFSPKLLHNDCWRHFKIPPPHCIILTNLCAPSDDSCQWWAIIFLQAIVMRWSVTCNGAPGQPLVVWQLERWGLYQCQLKSSSHHALASKRHAQVWQKLKSRICLVSEAGSNATTTFWIVKFLVNGLNLSFFYWLVMHGPLLPISASSK